MKLRTLALVTLLLPAIASARDISAGTFQLGGDANVAFSTGSVDFGAEEVDVDTFQLGASGLFYVIPNLGLGAFIDHTNTTTEFMGEESDSSSTVVGPQLSYNLSLAEQLSVFGTAGLGYATSEDDDQDADGFAWTIGGGLRFFPVRSVSLDGLVSYSNLNLEDDFDNEMDVSDLRIGVGLSFYFGGNP
jgi:hypothetical protein